MIRQSLAAASQGWHEIIFSDPDFSQEYVECLNLPCSTGVAGNEAIRCLALKKRLEAHFSNSTPAFASSVLDL